MIYALLTPTCRKIKTVSDLGAHWSNQYDPNAEKCGEPCPCLSKWVYLVMSSSLKIKVRTNLEVASERKGVREKGEWEALVDERERLSEKGEIESEYCNLEASLVENFETADGAFKVQILWIPQISKRRYIS